MSTQDPFRTPTPAPAPQQQGHEVAGHARSEVEGTAALAADKAGEVVDTAKAEIRDVVDEARDVVRRQADEQTRNAAGTLSKLTEDLRAMSGGGAPSETTAQYLERAAGSLEGVVGRLERDGIEGALSGVRGFARKSPGAFLLASAGAGFALGRLIRNGDHPQDVAEGGSSSTDDSPTERDTEIDLTDGVGGSRTDLGGSPATTVADSRYDAGANRIYADGGSPR
jgi:hypothetical protein